MSKMRVISRAALLVLGAVATGRAAGAQVSVVGTTSACFGLGCTNYSSTASFAIAGTNENLVFSGASFSGMTNPVTNGFTVGSFGTLVLVPPPTATTPNTTFSTPFSLLFTLTSPNGATSPSTTFTVNGFVGNTNGQGSRDISYGGASAAFTFGGGGVGTITVDGGFVGVEPTALSGRVVAAAGVPLTISPEPGTWALLGTGLVGLGAVARRRRANA